MSEQDNIPTRPDPAYALTLDGVASADERAEMRQYVRQLQSALHAAVGDVFMLTFLTEKIGLELGQAVGVLREFRDWRTEKDIDAWEGQP